MAGKIISGFVGNYRSKKEINKARNIQKEVTSHLTAEAYHAKYLIGGNASHSRFMRYVRMRRREANA